MAIGEGMLTGSVPIIWDWDGASEIWGEKYVITSITQAKDKFKEENLGDKDFIQTLNSLDASKVVTKWENIINIGN